MKSFYKTQLNSAARFGLAALALFLLFALAPGSSSAQWNTNTFENLEISGLTVADMHSVPTTDGKTWIAFYVQESSNYNMYAQLLDEEGYKLLGDDGVLVSDKPSGSATFVFN